MNWTKKSFPLTDNVALYKPAYQQYPLIGGDASNAVDGPESNLSYYGGQCAVSYG